jgi:hypothetical protein
MPSLFLYAAVSECRKGTSHTDNSERFCRDQRRGCAERCEQEYVSVVRCVSCEAVPAERGVRREEVGEVNLVNRYKDVLVLW